MNKKAIWQVIFEFLSIVFAVILALGLNSYKQNLDLKEESEALTSRIINECKGNLQRLDSVIIQNTEMLAYLDSLEKLEKVTNFGFSIADEQLLSSAWAFTKSSRSFQFMDDQFLNDATAVYQIQNYYTSVSIGLLSDIGQVMIRVDDVEPRTLLRTFRFYLSNILSSSIELQNYYQDFLEEHDAQ